MNGKNHGGRCLVAIVIASSALLIAGCVKMSEQIHDKTAGINGSFEVIQSDLPVNWIVYSPNTIPKGDYDLVVDTTEFVEGKQSLKFVVRECEPTGGWHSPGLSQEFPAQPGKTYRVSFWAMNDGSEFVVRIGGVSAKEGEYHTITSSDEPRNEWVFFAREHSISEGMYALRFELNIVKPGTFWIDDIRIENIDVSVD